jgi:Na+/proline symporter
VDGYIRLYLGKTVASGSLSAEESAAQVRVSRIATLAFGALGTLLACNVSRIGTLIEIANKLVNAFTGPLFGIFLLAMFSRRATSAAALSAGIAGAIAAYYVAYHSTIGFLWPSTFGLAASLVVGLALSALGTKRVPETADLTWWGVMRNPVRA